MIALTKEELALLHILCCEDITRRTLRACRAKVELFPKRNLPHLHLILTQFMLELASRKKQRKALQVDKQEFVANALKALEDSTLLEEQKDRGKALLTAYAEQTDELDPQAGLELLLYLTEQHCTRQVTSALSNSTAFSSLRRMVDAGNEIVQSMREDQNDEQQGGVDLIATIPDLMATKTRIPFGISYFDKATGGGACTGELAVIGAGTGGGKCHPAGTKVMMYDGSIKNVEDVVVGDQLMGPGYTPRNVLELGRGFSKLYMVRQELGEDYGVNEGHLLTVVLDDHIKYLGMHFGPKSILHDITVEQYMALSDQNKEMLRGVRHSNGMVIYTKIVDIEPLPDGNYYGFVLDGDHRYLLADGTITHNTMCATDIACNQAMLGNLTVWFTYEQPFNNDISERILANLTGIPLSTLRNKSFSELTPEQQQLYRSCTAGMDSLVGVDFSDTSNMDPTDEFDTGGVYSIEKQIKLAEQRTGRKCKFVILDWFGQIMDNQAALQEVDLSTNYRHFARKFVLELLDMIKRLDVFVLLFHQLNAKCCDASPTYIPNKTDFQDIKSLANHASWAFLIGKLDDNNVCWFRCDKGRRKGVGTQTIQLDGEHACFTAAEGWAPGKDGNFYNYKMAKDTPDDSEPEFSTRTTDILNAYL